MNKVKRTERGWAGHYCCADSCKFKRNTLLEYKGFENLEEARKNQYIFGGTIEKIGCEQ